MPSIPETPEEILEALNAIAVDAEPVLALHTVVRAGALPQEGEPLKHDDARVVFLLTFFDPTSEQVVRLPILFEFDMAEEVGILTEAESVELRILSNNSIDKHNAQEASK